MICYIYVFSLLMIAYIYTVSQKLSAIWCLLNVIMWHSVALWVFVALYCIYCFCHRANAPEEVTLQLVFRNAYLCYCSVYNLCIYLNLT